MVSNIIFITNASLVWKTLAGRAFGKRAFSISYQSVPKKCFIFGKPIFSTVQKPYQKPKRSYLKPIFLVVNNFVFNQ